MKLFVTGATGFLGRNILRKLEEEGYDTTGLLLPHEDAAGVALSRVVRGDITVPETLAGKMDGHAGVLHLAGAVGYGQAWEDCLKLNKEGTANIAAEAPTKRLPYGLALAVAGGMEAVSKLTRRPPRLTRYAVTVVGRQYHYDTTRMTEELGYLPKIGLMEGIRELVQGLP